MASEEVTCKTEEPSTILLQNPRPIYNPEELTAKSIAPVKAEHLLPPSATRERSSDDKVGVDDDSKERKGSTVLAKEKKSKRQAKRDRRQEQKSASNICPEVAKYGKSDACRFGTSCRFNHDLAAYLAEKPADLDGCCPFLESEKSCPYGITCRFFKTHKETEVSESRTTSERCIETNHLKKDVQKLLWKNKANFPKADAQLRLLGLRVGFNTKPEADSHQDGSHVDDINGSNAVSALDNKDTLGTDINNDSCGTNNNNEASGVDNAESASAACSKKDCTDVFVPSDSRPMKKTKCPSDEPSCPTETNNGKHVLESNMDETNMDGSVKEKNIDDSFDSCKSDTILRPHRREIKLIDFGGKLYLAPLTTVGNLPFRRICKSLGADITCGEMAMGTNLLQGQASEWALLRRHSSEDTFGVQVCGSYPDTLARTVELINRECEVDFIDINMGCPIDLVCNKGAGSSLLTKPLRMKNIIQAASRTIDKPITVKVRTGYLEGRNRIDSLISDISQCGASAITIHGRSRQQRYSKLADWDYIYRCARKAPKELSVIGNGDIFSYTDWNKHLTECPELSSAMIGRGALIKPWIFTEIKEQRHWDITSGERLEILKNYVNYGITHWGSDTKGVETTRHFLLEWLSYTYRYIPVGLLDVVPQRINWRSPGYFGRNDLETLMASDSAADWIRISEMLLGKVPEGFTFAPKHKSNAYDRAENG